MRWPFARRSIDSRKTRKPSRRSRRLAFDALEDRRLLTAAGLLDPTFGSGGIASQSFPYQQPSGDSGQLIAAEPTGGFVVGSNTNAAISNSQSTSFALTEYNANGTVDTSFGTNGTVYVPSSLPVDAIAVGPQGQVVVVGNAGSDGFGVDWYSATGVLENSVKTLIGPSVQGEIYQITADPLAVAFEPNGQVVVAGASNGFSGSSTPELVVARYDTDGTLDTSFGTAGIATDSAITWVGGTSALAIGSNGNIAVGGSIWNVSSGSADDGGVLAMLNPDGSVDSSFGNGGAVTTPAQAMTNVTALAFESDGDVVVGGSPGSVLSSNDQMSLARYNTSGALDTTFGTGGVVTTTEPISDSDSITVTNLEIQSSGSIVAVAHLEPPIMVTVGGVTSFGVATSNSELAASTSSTSISVPSVLLTSFNDDGSVNTSFGTDGIVDADATVSSLSQVSTAQLPNGDIVIVGTAGGAIVGTSIVAFNSSGTPDTSFNGTGSEVVHLGIISEPGSASATCETIQPDGKILVVGTAQTPTGSPPELVLTRYNTDGSLDTTFGTGGIVTTVWQQGFAPNAVTLQANGQIVIVGSVAMSAPVNDDGITSFALVRYNANGSVDTTFGSQGLVVTTFNGGDDYASSVAIDSSGRIVVAGIAAQTPPGPVSSLILPDPVNTNQVVVRYNANGSLDTTFAGTGIFVDTDVPANDTGQQENYPQVAIQANGKIVLGGDGLLQLNPDGTVDTTFGVGGVVPRGTSVLPAFVDELAIEPDGQILVAGNANLTSGAPFAYPTSTPFLARFNADGSVDSTFNGGQPVVEADTDEITALAVSSNGLIAITFDYTNSSSKTQSLVQVLDADGSVDAAFDNQSADLTALWNALAFDSEGNIVAAGGGPDLEVARFVGPPAPSTGLPHPPPPMPPTSPGTLSLLAPSSGQVVIELGTSTSFTVSINGTQTSYTTSQYDAVDVVGAAGSTVVVIATLGSTSTDLSPNAASIDSTNLSIAVSQVTNIYVYGSSQETALLYGNPEATNTLVDASQYAYMEGSGYAEFAVGFGASYGYAASSQDTAYTYAGASDTFVATSTYSYLSSGGYFNVANGFASTLAEATPGGTAQAWLYGPSGGGTFYAGNAYSYLSGSGFFNEVTGFQSVTGVSSGTSDYAYLDDTAGGATFIGNATGSTLVGAGFSFQALGFANIVATGTANDTATLYDTNPGDPISQQGKQVILQRPTGTTLVNTFTEVDAHVTNAQGVSVIDTYDEQVNLESDYTYALAALASDA